MSYGPNPWQQAHWDWRAAGNFICGGAGSGLIVFAALSGGQGRGLSGLILSGLALVGLGLMCVWLEIGRPWRSLNVFFNPRSSWMSREALTALLLFPAGLAAAAGLLVFVPVTAVLALFFLFCQGRMLRAARGIPAWREPLASSLIAVTGLTEGAGLFFLSAPLHQAGTRPLLIVFGALLLARVLLWLAYRKRLGACRTLGIDSEKGPQRGQFLPDLQAHSPAMGQKAGEKWTAAALLQPMIPKSDRLLATQAAPRALAALDRAGRWLQIAGTWLPLALIAIATGAASAALAPLLAALAGFMAALAGGFIKYTLLTRAGFNQGFALVHLPVRGVRQEGEPWA